MLRTVHGYAQVLQSLESANAQAQEALMLVERQYALGAASCLQLLVFRQQLQQTHIGALELCASQLSNTVSLYQAMGGGSILK